jgi:hypothetical protein
LGRREHADGWSDGEPLSVVGGGSHQPLRMGSRRFLLVIKRSGWNFLSFLQAKHHGGGGLGGELIARRLGGDRANLTASSRLIVFLGDRRCPLLTRRVFQSWKGILLTGFSHTTYYRQIEGQPISGESDDG